MANKEKVDYLLLDIRELEKLVAGIRDAEIYPVSFFSQTFDLTHKILKDLHLLESDQIETLKKQMEEHLRLIESIPASKASPLPEPIAEELVEEQVVKDEIVTVEPLPVDKPIEKLVDAPIEKISVPRIDKQPVYLNELLERKNLSDFRKALSLNDRFYFRRELFAGDEAKMNKVITDLNDIHSYEESIAYLNEKLNWNIEDETVNSFIKLLEKRFL